MLHPQSELKSRLSSLRNTLLQGLVERDTPVRLALLAALAGEHLLLIGPPGTAKSEVARRLRHAFRDSSYFERLLTRFSVPEELFGPLSVRALEQDRYHRQIQGYLPTSSVAFLDEIFKANSAILNSLLTILNEREFDNGTERISVPLVSVIGASNELPDGEELHALYDRFLLRCHVGPVSATGFESLLDLRGNEQPKPELALRLTRADLAEFREQCRLVRVPEDIRALLKGLREFAAAQKIAVSDRRWRKIVFLLQVSAFTDGRNEVSVWDGWLLQHCVWEKPEQRQAISDWYEARLGAGATAEPARFEKLVAAHEAEVERERESRSQARDARGRLLYVGPEGQLVPEEEGQRQVQRNGKPVYLAPASGASDRSNGGKGYLEEELRRHFEFGRYGVPDLRSYVGDTSNWFMGPSANPPHIEPTRYSSHHVDGRIGQVEELRNELGVMQRGLEKQLETVTTVVEGHLWISPGFTEPARRHLDERRKNVEKLSARLEGVLSDLRALPRSAS